MNKSEKFALVMTPTGKRLLHELANREQISAASLVRRWIFQNAEKDGLWSVKSIDKQTKKIPDVVELLTLTHKSDKTHDNKPLYLSANPLSNWDYYNLN